MNFELGDLNDDIFLPGEPTNITENMSTADYLKVSSTFSDRICKSLKEEHDDDGIIWPSNEASNSAIPNLPCGLGFDDVAMKDLKELLDVDSLSLRCCLFDETEVTVDHSTMSRECVPATFVGRDNAWRDKQRVPAGPVSLARHLSPAIRTKLNDQFDHVALREQLNHVLDCGNPNEAIGKLEAFVQVLMEERDSLKKKTTARIAAADTPAKQRAVKNKIAEDEARITDLNSVETKLEIVKKAVEENGEIGQAWMTDLIDDVMQLSVKKATQLLCIKLVDEHHTYERVVFRASVDSHFTCHDMACVLEDLDLRLISTGLPKVGVRVFDGAFCELWDANTTAAGLATRAIQSVRDAKAAAMRTYNTPGARIAKWRLQRSAILKLVEDEVATLTEEMTDAVRLIAQKAKEATESPPAAAFDDSINELKRRCGTSKDTYTEIERVASAILYWIRIAKMRNAHILAHMIVISVPNIEDVPHKQKNFWTSIRNQGSDATTESSWINKRSLLKALDLLEGREEKAEDIERIRLTRALLTGAVDDQSTASAETVFSQPGLVDALRELGLAKEAERVRHVLEHYEAWQLPGLSPHERARRVNAFRDFIVEDLIGSRRFWPTEMSVQRFQGVSKQLVLAWVYNASSRSHLLEHEFRGGLRDTALCTDPVENLWSWIVKRSGWKPFLHLALSAMRSAESLVELRLRQNNTVRIPFGKRGFASSHRLGSPRNDEWNSGECDGDSPTAKAKRAAYWARRAKIARQHISRQASDSIRHKVHVSTLPAGDARLERERE